MFYCVRLEPLCSSSCHLTVMSGKESFAAASNLSLCLSVRLPLRCLSISIIKSCILLISHLHPTPHTLTHSFFILLKDEHEQSQVIKFSHLHSNKQRFYFFAVSFYIPLFIKISIPNSLTSSVSPLLRLVSPRKINFLFRD